MSMHALGSPRQTMSGRRRINGVQMYHAQLGRNDLIGGRTDGMIALQAHWSATYERVAGSFDMSGSWKPGAAHRYRNIAIKELPR